MREQLHQLVDQLSEEQMASVLQLVRDQLEDVPKVRHLPWIGTMAAGPDFAEQSEDVLHGRQP